MTAASSIMDSLQAVHQRLSESKRQDIIGTIKSLKLGDQMPKGWEEKITADHLIILPEAMADQSPDASNLSFIRFDKHLPPGQCLIAKSSVMF